ncbi:MAG: beta-glucosidase [Gammaproteobacteria bacterium]|nr:beta-glucosidase [Gammaproteobacteria bacterium]
MHGLTTCRSFGTALRWRVLAGLLCIPAMLHAEAARPWLDKARTPDERAKLAVAAMTLTEKLTLLHGPSTSRSDGSPLPADAVPSAGYIPGIPRLGIPALTETDASLGVTNPRAVRPGDVATALPAGLALAATFSTDFAYQSGAIVGAEAHAKGFNVLLGGGMDLTRDPRNGRNFEYLGEDPLLAGELAAEAVRGTQDQHVISTLKHFALNAHETNRTTLDAKIDRAALRESDLLAFQIAIEHSQPGSIMCAYNKINGEYSCGNTWLLNEVLKQNWRYPGWVMSDWGAVHSETDVLRGLDQESGQQHDKLVYFADPLTNAVQRGQVPVARIDDMARRILRSMFAVGVVDFPPDHGPINYKAHALKALEVAQNGIVLLKNAQNVLPLPTNLTRIAVIGGQAGFGVLSGGGSAQVTPSNGPVVKIPIGGVGGMSAIRNEVFFPSPPAGAIHEASPNTQVRYDSGSFPADAAALAAKSDIAIVFVTRHEMEGYDIPNLQLPNGQDQLVDAVAAANPHTIVVLETGNPVAMPWLDKVAAVVAAWYPGQDGGTAIAQLLFGASNPSGRLPITFPQNEAQSVRPTLPNLGAESHADVTVDYTEGADVGYRWYARHGITPLFSFGYGLSYTTFKYENLKVTGGKTLAVTFDVLNTGSRAGTDIPQVYLTSAVGTPDLRLVGFSRMTLQPGERKSVTVTADRRLLGHYDEAHHKWRVAAGKYAIRLGRSATDLLDEGSAAITAATFGD